MSTQQDFLSLPSMSQTKNNQVSADHEKFVDFNRRYVLCLDIKINYPTAKVPFRISYRYVLYLIVSHRFTFSFNDLLIDETPPTHASNSSTKPNESSLEDLDNGEETDEQAQDNGLDNKTLLVTLMKQINLLHETNTKIFRNLHETKSERGSQIWKKNSFEYFSCSSRNGSFEICSQLGLATP